MADWHSFMDSEMWDREARTELCNALDLVQFFVSKSREDGIDAIRAFLAKVKQADTTVGTETRFSGNWYVSYRSDVREILIDLQNNLSWRESNIAKDTEVHKSVRSPNPAEPQTGDQKGFLGQSAQDALRAYAVNQQRLVRWFRENHWYRARFEAELHATWPA